jgi:hypothetical protein
VKAQLALKTRDCSEIDQRANAARTSRHQQCLQL